MSEIVVHPLGPGRYAVDVSEGAITTHHKVSVPAGLLDDIGLTGADGQALVREAFAYLLAREPVTAIGRDFPIDQMAQHHADFWDELRVRLT
jgi:hypothetical protein